MKTNLVTRDSKGNIRVVYISLIEEDDGTYKIERQSGLLDGKLIQQPTLYIKKGKVKRTVKQQAELEYNSIIKKQLDKGYKDCNDLGITNLTVSAINTVLPKTKTDNKQTMVEADLISTTGSLSNIIRTLVSSLSISFINDLLRNN